MGLFGEQAANEEMEAKDRQIAELQAQLAKKSVTSKVAASDIIDDSEGGSLNAVSVKLPPFTESNPELWFGKAEAQFVLRGVKDRQGRRDEVPLGKEVREVTVPEGHRATGSQVTGRPQTNRNVVEVPEAQQRPPQCHKHFRTGVFD